MTIYNGNSFNELYSSKMVPLLKRIKNEQKRFLKMAVIEVSIISIVYLFLIYKMIYPMVVLFLSGQYQLPVVLFTFMFITALFVVLLKTAYQAYYYNFHEKVKPNVLPTFLKSICDWKWSESEIFCAEDIKSYGFCQKGTLLACNDAFTSELNNLKVQEADFYHRLPSKSGERDESDFRGLIIEFSCSKKFTGYTAVLTDKNERISPKFTKLECVNLEDTNFEKKYFVYSDNQVESRYILTPIAMEKLKDIENYFAATKIEAAFYKNKFILLLSTKKPLFELGNLYQFNFNKAVFYELYKEILSVKNLITALQKVL